ncbi:MAG TPA: methyltransferase domain-containing protein [Candidatus Polarisedimenticolia bacterium]|nr:methyltransferase domain-containing protein [Candidatus Polarisedimenticolia bacterium]
MDSQEIKRRVMETYAAAVTQGSSCCEPAAPRRTAAVPEAASCCGKTESPGGARSSFGCGDPLALADVGPGQTVLDVGSGPGADALAASLRVGPRGRVIGVDMTDAMLEKARQAALSAGASNVDFRKGDAEALPAADGEADWVISNCVVNLVPDKSRAFAEIFRVLKPGGRFSITDLVGENLPPEITGDPEAYCRCIGGADSEAAYLKAIRDAGFADVAVLDRFEWEAPELEGTAGRVWSLKVTGRRPPAAA